MPRSKPQGNPPEDLPTAGDPISLVEEFCISENIQAERTADHELMGEFQGQWSDYRLWVVFHEEMVFLQFNCYLDIKIPDRSLSAVADLMSRINERIWLGHYEIWWEELVPVFRIVLPLRGVTLVAEQIEDIMTAIMQESERFFPAFQWVIWGGKTPQEAIFAAIVDTEGEA